MSVWGFAFAPFRSCHDKLLIIFRLVYVIVLSWNYLRFLGEKGGEHLVFLFVLAYLCTHLRRNELLKCPSGDVGEWLKPPVC